MKRAFVVFAALVLLVGSAFAQEWSAEQKEVIAQIKTCWDANVRAYQEKNSDPFFAACSCEKDAYWWVVNSQIFGHDFTKDSDTVSLSFRTVFH